MEGCQWGGGGRRAGGKVTGTKKPKWQVQSRQEEVKNSIGNGEAKELICMTHGHELGGGECWREEGTRQRSVKERKKMGEL